MTIEKRIKDELKRLSDQNPALYSTAHSLEQRFHALTDQVRDYLSKINSEMPEYDKHDASHSEAVLENIEQLLQTKGIEKLSLLEAIVLRFCCYFHDCGMILPSYCTPLLEKVEADPNADPAEGLEEWLAAEGRTFAQVRDLFLIPGSRDGYLDLLLGELEAYQAYWQGLPPAPESMKQGDYIKTKRHDHLRSTHSARTKTYAANLSRFFGEIIQGGEMDLAKAIGDICAAHGWEYQQVRKLPVSLELFRNCPEMGCNVRYLAMLLRMGDLLHFGPDRASGVLYIEQEQVGPQSDLHWLAKMNTRGYRIDPTADGGVDITYHGSFTEPREYYFILEHMDRVDEELSCYEAFRREMEKQLKENLYDLGLPEKVDRDHIAHQGFEPDQDLKFKLEHQNIIRLLMGARLYRDEFMCLRELYQNALDACRCMRAEQKTRYGTAGELEIEFGLGRDDDGGDYLYCKDQGTGMTMDIVKNYLLRIGNSYYKSDEFRRRNAQWNNAVAPVSEFGIGLLSCYMIADRIDIITRHYTAPEGEGPIWISMKDTDGFGYRRPTNRFQERQLGRHGTIVKLYLLDKFKDKVTGYIPEDPRDAVFMLDRYTFNDAANDPPELKTYMEQFQNSLYHRVQQFVHIPKEGIPVWIRGAEKREKLFRADEVYDLFGKISFLRQYALELRTLLWNKYDVVEIMGVRLNTLDHSAQEEISERVLRGLDTYHCLTEPDASGIAVGSTIALPSENYVNYSSHYQIASALPVSSNDGSSFYIDGMPAYYPEMDDVLFEAGCVYHFSGSTRPLLTVDRGAVRDIPPKVIDSLPSQRCRIRDILIAQIREHFQKKPGALTLAAQGYVFHYLFKKYRLAFCVELLAELSKDILRDYAVFGVPLYDWLHKPSQILCPDTLIPEWTPSIDSFKLNLLAAAGSVRYENEHIFLTSHIDLSQLLPDRYSLGSVVIALENWPKVYSQYDAVRSLAGFVPEHTYSLIADSDDKFGHVNLAGGVLCLGNMAQAFDPVKMDTFSMVELFYKLSGAPGTCDSNNPWEDPFITPDSKRYILYIYINPRPLTEEDELFLTRYCSGVPKYREGVEKGWSILFYNYKNGYVIAPGIVDRMEMLELLPEEARNHDDGLEYYFTDGTPAF